MVRCEEVAVCTRQPNSKMSPLLIARQVFPSSIEYRASPLRRSTREESFVVLWTAPGFAQPVPASSTAEVSSPATTEIEKRSAFLMRQVVRVPNDEDHR